MSAASAPSEASLTAVPAASSLPPKPASTSSTASSSTSATTTSSSSTPPSRFTIDKTALVCDKAVLEGTITIAANTIIHPRARLIAPPSSSITVGANTLIEDAATVIAPPHTHLTLGNWLLLEPLTTVHASMGHANHVRVGAIVTQQAKVGRGVEVGVRAVVDGPVEDGSVVSSDGSERRASEGGWTAREREKRVMEAVQMQLMASRELLIKAHKMIR